MQEIDNNKHALNLLDIDLRELFLAIEISMDGDMRAVLWYSCFYKLN